MSIFILMLEKVFLKKINFPKIFPHKIRFSLFFISRFPEIKCNKNNHKNVNLETKMYPLQIYFFLFAICVEKLIIWHA